MFIHVSQGKHRFCEFPKGKIEDDMWLEFGLSSLQFHGELKIGNQEWKCDVPGNDQSCYLT